MVSPLSALLQSKVSNKLETALASTPLPPRAVNHIAEAVSSGGASAAARGVPAPVRGVVAFVGAVLALVLVRRRDFVTAPAGAPPTASAEAAR